VFPIPPYKWLLGPEPSWYKADWAQPFVALREAMATEWALRGKPTGEAFDQQWDAMAVDVAFRSGWVYDLSLSAYGGFHWEAGA
jgi:hypothetical protein